MGKAIYSSGWQSVNSTSKSGGLCRQLQHSLSVSGLDGVDSLEDHMVLEFYEGAEGLSAAVLSASSPGKLDIDMVPTESPFVLCFAIECGPLFNIEGQNFPVEPYMATLFHTHAHLSCVGYHKFAVNFSRQALVLIVELSLEYLRKNLELNEFENLLTQLPSSDGPIASAVQGLTGEMHNTLLGIRAQHLSPGLRRLYLGNCAAALSACFLNDLIEKGAVTQASDLKLETTRSLHRAREILSENYLSPPTLNQLARQVGINRNKLCMGFRKLFGSTVFDYCHRLRMQNARKLLLHKPINIAQVAQACGYEHAGNFTAAYKRHFGELPKDLKHRLREEISETSL